VPRASGRGSEAGRLVAWGKAAKSPSPASSSSSSNGAHVPRPHVSSQASQCGAGSPPPLLGAAWPSRPEGAGQTSSGAGTVCTLRPATCVTWDLWLPFCCHCFECAERRKGPALAAKAQGRSDALSCGCCVSAAFIFLLYPAPLPVCPPCLCLPCTLLVPTACRGHKCPPGDHIPLSQTHMPLH
jgi:hypothetical protein